MTQDIELESETLVDQAVVKYMKFSALSGHLEHTYNDVQAGVADLTAAEIYRSLTRLEKEKRIGKRSRGKRVKTYFLMGIVTTCQDMWSSEFNRRRG